MSMIDRIKNICLTPTTEWPVIAQEPSSSGSLITGYLVPLAAVSALAGFIGGSIVGVPTFAAGYVRVPFFLGLWSAVISLVLTVVGVIVCSVIINLLAPTFGGQKDSTRALKVAVYSFTPGLAAGVLQIIPAIGLLAALASLYGLYVLYLGLSPLMRSPQDKSAGYTVVTVLSMIAVAVVWFGFVAVTGFGAATATGMLRTSSTDSVPSSTAASDVQADPNSPLGRLQELGKAMEESGKKMEAAQKSGDANAQTTAAMDALGTLLGGGKRVDPLSIDQLKVFVPESFAGLRLQGVPTVEKTGFGSLMVSRAEARYGDGANQTVTLEIVDSGGASGLMGLASWAGVQGARESEDGSEKTEKIGGRIVHEKRSRSGNDEFGIVLGDRFIVSAESGDMDVDRLKAAVNALDLRTIEGMKDVGVQKP